MLAHQNFLSLVNESIKRETFIKLSLNNYQGEENALQRIYAKLVLLKGRLMLSFTYRYKTKVIIKNYEIPEAMDLVTGYLANADFLTLTLNTQFIDCTLKRNKKYQWKLLRRKVKGRKKLSFDHDRKKQHILDPKGKIYLQQLKLTGADGEVFKTAQDKWKQINHYIALLQPALRHLKNNSPQIADMGSGKGYLTFALYDYLTSQLNLSPHITGVEYRKDLVEFCNQVAKEQSFSNLSFWQGGIEDYKPKEKIDILIALHACDTATDDAISKGIKEGSELIVVAPCCHKQVRKEMEKNKVLNTLEPITKHGIFLERQAEMLTDSIRVLIMEYFGYHTKVTQFISDEHTPKNVLIIGSKRSTSQEKQAEIKEKISQLKAFFGVDSHHLESLLEI